MKELLSNKPYRITYQIIEEGFLLLEWPSLIDDDINAHVLSLKNEISDVADHIVDLVPSYCSLAIFYDIRFLCPKDLLYQIKMILTEDKKKPLKPIKEIPVCYDLSLALDLQEMSNKKGLLRSELISLHCSPTYRVAFLGFLPGFVYLSGLDKRLHHPRKKEPRLSIPKGSVAIGGEQTGIYPISSPGGWNIIGRSPITLFDQELESPSPFEPGDRIRFKPISISEYNKALKK